MAACVLVGLLIAKLRPQPVRTEIVVQEKLVAPQAILAVNDPRPSGELWSAQRIYQNAIDANRNERPAKTVIRSFQ
jgi:hypothetical protein